MGEKSSLKKELRTSQIKLNNDIDDSIYDSYICVKNFHLIVIKINKTENS